MASLEQRSVPIAILSLSRCEKEMARKPKAELRMTASFVLKKLQLIQRNVDLLAGSRLLFKHP